MSIISLIKPLPKLRGQISSELMIDARWDELMREGILKLLVPVQAKHSPNSYFEAAIVSSHSPRETESDLDSNVQSIMLHAVATVDSQMACEQEVVSVGIR